MTRIVLFGATGYTGRLAAESMVERGLRPVLAARGREALEQMAADLGGLETARGRRLPADQRAHAGRARRRAGHDGRPVRALGRGGRGGGLVGGRALHRLDRRARVHPSDLRGLRARRRTGRQRDADRLRLRLGAGQPRGRDRARARRRGRHPGRHRLLHHRQGRGERRHDGVHRRGRRGSELRVSRGARPNRARREAGAQLRARIEEARRDLRRQLGALRPAQGRPAAARGERLPRLVRARSRARCS